VTVSGNEQPDPNTLYRAACAYARSGQPVFPCKSSGPKAKAPLNHNGVNGATTDVSQIRRWWRARGDAAIGIATGHLYDVLDVDIKEQADGRVHLPMLHRLGLLNGCKRVVKTPSGGWHLYFPSTKGLTNKARGTTLGMDVRGLGGYVIAPPSYLTDAVNAEGTIYSGPYVDHGPTEDSTDDPLWWDLIAATIAPVDTDTNKPIQLLPSERRASLAALREWVSTLNKGERNNGFHWAVSRCVDNGIDPDELIEAALLTGLEEDEVKATIGSALKRAGLTTADMVSEAEALFPDEA